MKGLTLSKFIDNAIVVHGNRYDYSKVNYVNNRTKVEIICKTHGSFWQKPNSHVDQKQGCLKCSGKNIPSTEEFILRAKSIHGDVYDYSRAKYSTCRVKVEIVCPSHGSFWKSPNLHIHQRQGCPECGEIQRIKSKTFTQQEFLDDAQSVHGNLYDYSKSCYEHTDKKIEIVCSKHGSFWQSPHSHLNGNGCPKCANEENAESQTFTQEEWIDAVKLIHGNLFDYSRVHYEHNTKKVEIVCRKHGSFWQQPNLHLHGETGCPKCKSSKAERKIIKWLDDHHIPYVHQKTFPDLLNSTGNKRAGRLKFDFFLTSKNILIEFDGEQHFKCGVRLGYKRGHVFTREEFNELKRRDHIKTNYANSRNIRLVRIPYTQRKSLDSILTCILE
jgi:Zn finger protein HypA/HybF involved in hydrogenase expression